MQSFQNAFEQKLKFVQILESQIEVRKECLDSFKKKWQTLSIL